MNEKIYTCYNCPVNRARKFPLVSARQVRTFGAKSISKKDLQEFPILEKYLGKDISYIIYSSIEINSNEEGNNER